MKITEDNALTKFRAALTNDVDFDPAVLMAEQADATKRATTPGTPPREATSAELQTFYEALTDTQPAPSPADLDKLRAALAR